jgi:MFS family permease
MSQPNSYNRIALAACFGTFIEWYDFLTFATLAVHFAALFFPADDPVAGLLYSLAAFGIGMVVRPLGAAVFGSFGDRYGRRTVFIATIGIMGLATFLVSRLYAGGTKQILPKEAINHFKIQLTQPPHPPKSLSAWQPKG